MYIPKGFAMVKTKLFKNGNSQAVRIPAELAYSTWEVDLVIERQGDELHIRPAHARMGLKFGHSDLQLQHKADGAGRVVLGDEASDSINRREC